MQFSVKSQLIFLLKYILFWILLFDFQRILFSIHFYEKLSITNFSEWIGVFYYSIKLDLATACILTAPLILWLFIKPFTQNKWITRFFKFLLFLCVLLVCLIHAGEINAYGEWNHKLTTRVFTHLANPDEVFRTADYTMTILFFVYLILELKFAQLMWKVLNKEFFFRFEFSEVKKKLTAYISYVFVTILFIGVLIIGARGGLQQIPINTSSSTYSNHAILNDISTNSAFFFGSSYIHYNKADVEHLLPDIDEEVATQRVEELYSFPDGHQQFITSKEPNIVLILLESWTSEAVGILSENKGATPNFDSLTKSGVLFDNIHSCGSTSEIGNSSLFSGYPAIPGVFITWYPEKNRQLRSFNQDLQDSGYHTGYVFSGDLRYGKIGGYLMEHGFDDLKDEKDFPSHLEKGKLNYYDEALYELLTARINNSPEPFLHCAFTGSTHSPYDHPKRENQNWSGSEENFMNSVIYADEELGKFLMESKNEPWYDNTLFILTADHGHSAPNSTNPNESKHYRIPLLFYGNVIDSTYRGKRINVLGSQSDIAATVLAQLGIEHKKNYPFSRDLTNPNMKEFVLHTIIGGFGWKSPTAEYSYHIYNQQVIKDSISDDEKLDCHSFLRVMYNDFDNR